MRVGACYDSRPDAIKRTRVVPGGETMGEIEHRTTSSHAAWYVLQTKPLQEDRAESNLIAWGVETLLPRIWAARSRARRIQPVPQPLFPSYLFASFDAASMLGKIRYTRGVTRILGTEHGPSAVDPGVIALIRGRIADDGYVSLVSALQPGDRVRIAAGPLKDFVGVFESMAKPSQRVRLLLAAVTGQMRVVVDGTVVEKVPASLAGW